LLDELLEVLDSVNDFAGKRFFLLSVLFSLVNLVIGPAVSLDNFPVRPVLYLLAF